MKKHDLLKVLGITFLVVVVLSWIIPGGSYSNGTFTAGTTQPIGLVDFVRLPIITFATFIQYGIIFLLIGGLYGVLNKTGVYHTLIEKVTKSWKGKEKKFLVIVMIVLSVLASVTGLNMLLFVTVPFLAALLLSMGYSKIIAMVATIGSILVGNIGSTYGFSASGYVKNAFNLSMNDEILSKIIFFIIIAFLFIMFVLKSVKKQPLKVETADKKKEVTDKKKKTNKKETVTEVVKDEKVKVELPFVEETTTKKKSMVPLAVIGILFLVICAIGMYNWYYAFGITFFQSVHESIMKFAIKDYPIFANILGDFTQIGYWGNYELAVCLIIGTAIIAWVYNVKWNELIDGFIAGMKKMLPVAFYALLANVVFAFIFTSSTGDIFSTMLNFFGSMTKDMNVFTTALTGGIGSFFYNDFYYLMSSVSNVFAVFDKGLLPLIGFILQSVFGLVMVIAPTSLLLVAGLKFFDVSFKDWFKYIWKYLIEVLVIIIVIALIIFALI